MDEKTLFILRGLQGSGKSTLARRLKYDTYGCLVKKVICSTDDFWVVGSGRKKAYTFNPIFLSEAHQWNLGRVAHHMHHGFDTIIVDNTNIYLQHMLAYIKLAEKAKYTVVMLQPDTEWAKNPKECYLKNSHGVPLEVIERNAREFEQVGEIAPYVYEITGKGI